MPDISKCANASCAKKESCWRWVATPSRWQSYAEFQPNETGECEDYWPVESDVADDLRRGGSGAGGSSPV